MADTAPAAVPARGYDAHIAVDAMGGDAPLSERVSGALAAARIYGDTEVLLCGALAEVEAEIHKLGQKPENVTLVDASELIGMHEPPVRALREKKNSPIVIGVQMVADGRADAFVSAGNTGAVAAASSLKLGRLKHVLRPGIAVTMQIINYPVVAIDVGANMDCKPAHLLQYGIMASVFASEVLEIQNPRVGLLNVGEEPVKGNDVAKQTFELLSGAGLNFVGNVEPEMLFRRGCDILVCDGFVGNILLKVSESVALSFVAWLREQFHGSLRYKLGFALCKDLFGHLKQCADFSEYGGAPLLGVNGVIIITHGTSDARGIQNAIREARASVELDVNKHIQEAVRKDATSRGSRA
ncbi:MAG: phosphate acyltransferase PlsX [Candidatus Brocadiae bacterium]|nr:phosphate acyltransferase PlsX [Candidatus Brocadiia bacterium]